jgi:hypothetical protein
MHHLINLIIFMAFGTIFMVFGTIGLSDVASLQQGAVSRGTIETASLRLGRTMVPSPNLFPSPAKEKTASEF